MKQPDDVLQFWFGEIADGFAHEHMRDRWFQSSDEFDASIEQQFAPTMDAAADGACDGWCEHPEGCLAFIVLCDQFPRNVYRGTARAFAWDDLALDVAKAGIRAGHDRALSFDARGFFYLPFEHSEDLIDQHTSVGLFTQLRDETPQGQRHLTGSTLNYAHRHRDVIMRFGRFPHRNEALGRASTPEEQAYLADGGGF